MSNRMNEQQLVEKLRSLSDRYILAIRTDKADFETHIDSADNLLEVRAFNENGEFRAYRSLVGDEFKVREIDGNDGTYADGYFDESHYLDIDTAKTDKMDDGFVYTTGGGRFTMPASAGKLLKVRYYYMFDEDGIARKYDWRLVGFTDKEGE